MIDWLRCHPWMTVPQMLDFESRVNDETKAHAIQNNLVKISWTTQSSQKIVLVNQLSQSPSFCSNISATSDNP